MNVAENNTLSNRDATDCIGYAECPTTCQLLFYHAHQWFSDNPTIIIDMDGKTSYSLESGAVLRLAVTNGMHEIAFSCNYCYNRINIQVYENTTLNIKCNRFTGSIEINQ